MIELIIFDLDGLLADTEKLHMKSYRKVLADLKYNLTAEVYEDHWIRRGKGIVEFLSENNLKHDIALIRKFKATEYEKLVKAEAKPMPGAEELLRNLHSRKFKTALATASFYQSAVTVLDTLKIRNYFQFIASKENIKRNKPFPDIFLYAAAHFNIDPKNCIVLEDAEKGILAAYSAGMKCIAVPNLHTKDNDFSKATYIAESLNEVNTRLADYLEL
jgi:HAD superfamily hydrolase (TIGR01509 family)